MKCTSNEGNKFLKTASEIIRKAAGLLNGISCAALAGLMLLVTINVILRAVFKFPILGTYDLTGFLTIVAIGCGLAFCSIDNGHIEITFFVDKIGGKARKWITVIGRAFSFLILSVYTYALVALGTRLMKANEISVTTHTPLGIFAYFLAICFFVFAITVLVDIFNVKPGGNQA